MTQFRMSPKIIQLLTQFSEKILMEYQLNGTRPLKYVIRTLSVQSYTSDAAIRTVSLSSARAAISVTTSASTR